MELEKKLNESSKVRFQFKRLEKNPIAKPNELTKSLRLSQYQKSIGIEYPIVPTYKE